MKNAQSKHRREVWETFWDDRSSIETVYSNSDRIISQLRRTEDLRDKIVLEVGAGSGRDGFRLVDLGATVILLDYAESSLRVMQRLSRELNKPVHLVQGDAFSLPFRDGVLDVTFHQGLLEHFKDPSGIVSETHRVLKPGAFALADVPQRYHLYTMVKHILIAFDRWFAGWETEFSGRQLRALYKKNGFVIERTYGDWMQPSFFYRVTREIAKRLGLRLPLYPPRIPGIHSMRRRLKSLLLRQNWMLNTVMDIGVIARK
jgi:ubiquinone/menaquinone biosynthesis C-methylase UbiE